MKIKIVKCSNNWNWYDSRIGETFNVHGEKNKYYLVFDYTYPGSAPLLYVSKEDAEIVTT